MYGIQDNLNMSEIMAIIYYLQQQHYYFVIQISCTSRQLFPQFQLHVENTGTIVLLLEQLLKTTFEA